jgi:hypothetical protein
MKHLKLILIFYTLLLCNSTLYSQPYIYFSEVIDSTDSNPIFWKISIKKINLKNNLEESFLYDAVFSSYTWDRTQTWLILDRLYWYSHIYNCLDTLNNFDLPTEIEGGVFPVLYSKEKNILYITGVLEDKLKMFEFNINTKDLTQSFEEFPQIILNNKQGMFFSANEEQIYVPIIDTVAGSKKLLIYSTTSRHVLSDNDLSIYGYPGADGYLIYQGRDGISTIDSYLHNATKDSYFRVYNFDTNIGSNFIKYSGFADPYFTNNGKYIVLVNTYDSSNAYTGNIDIYDVATGEHIKNFVLSSNGEIYTFDEFPNNIYYVNDIELTTRQVWNLDIDSIFNVLDLTSLNPNTINIGSNLFALTINGKGFDTLSTVYFNGQEKVTTFISDSVLSAEVLASDVSIAGSFPVWVKDRYSISDTLQLTVTQANNPNLVVNLKNSTGTILTTGALQYYEGSWKDAANNGDGTFTVITNLNAVSLRMTYEYGSQTVNNIIAHNNYYSFTTVNAAVQLKNSLGNLIDVGTVQYYAGAWRSFGTTSNGVAYKELLPINYSFRMTYEYSSIDKQQNLSSDPTVVFQTVNTAVQLKNSLGNLIDAGTVQYYAGAWRSFGTTSNGVAYKELLPVNYSFRMTYEYVSKDKQQNLGTNPVVDFNTALCSVKVSKTSNTQPINNAAVKYYSGAWRNLGTTNIDGIATKELLPANISFRATLGSVSLDKQQDISVNNLVEILLNVP